MRSMEACEMSFFSVGEPLGLLLFIIRAEFAAGPEEVGEMEATCCHLARNLLSTDETYQSFLFCPLFCCLI